jgi:hypothetical protein
MRQPHYVTETQQLRAVVSNQECRYIFTRHAEKKMKERKISAEDIRHALMNGHVTLSELKRDQVWRVEGTDIDGRRIRVEVAVYVDAVVVKVITTF